MANSLHFGDYDSATGVQAGYAQVATDQATLAWLCDVYIARGSRGKRPGHALVAAVYEHLTPYGLRRVLLATADAHAIYTKSGFATLQKPEK